MIKLTAHRRFLVLLVSVIIFIITYALWTVQGHIESKYINVAFVGIVFFGFSFAGVFAGIKEAKNMEKKLLTGLIGNVILNVLFLAALFYVVLTMK